MLRTLDMLLLVLLMSAVIQLATCVHHDLAKTKPANPESQTSHSHSGHTDHNHGGSSHRHENIQEPRVPGHMTHVDIHGQPTHPSPAPPSHAQKCESHVDRPGQHDNFSPVSVIHRHCEPHGHGTGTHVGGHRPPPNPSPIPPNQDHTCESHVDRPGQHDNFSPVSVIHRHCEPRGHGGHNHQNLPGRRPILPPNSVQPNIINPVPNIPTNIPITPQLNNFGRPPFEQWTPNQPNPMFNGVSDGASIPNMFGTMQFPFEPQPLGPFSPTPFGIVPSFTGAFPMDPLMIQRRRRRRFLILRRLERLETVNTQLLRLLTGLVGRIPTSG